MQNIFLGSKNIKIQWLSNEDPVVPAKDNPDGDIFAHDFYDKTEFETILTSVELEKTLGRSKRMILPKEDALAEKGKQAEPRKGRRAASNISYDHDSYDFLEDDDDEVMPAPKKRKSQDSLDMPDEGSKVEGEKVSSAPRVQTEKKKEEKVETQPEELSTSEKAALAEKAKMESEEKEKEEDSANATSEAQQHAKKRGRKPKP